MSSATQLQLVPEHQRAMDLMAERATPEIFGAYGLDLIRADVEQTPGDVTLCGIIGFSGPGVRGTCTLATTAGPLDATNIAKSPHRDWIAELTNQIMGRIKALLLAREVEVYITTPVVMRGERLAPVTRGDSRPTAFHNDEHGSVFVWTEIETAPEISIAVDADEGAVTPLDADAVLF